MKGKNGKNNNVFINEDDEKCKSVNCSSYELKIKDENKGVFYYNYLFEFRLNIIFIK